MGGTAELGLHLVLTGSRLQPLLLPSICPARHPTERRPFKAQIIKVPCPRCPPGQPQDVSQLILTPVLQTGGGGWGFRDTCEVKQVRLPSLLLFLLGFWGTPYGKHSGPRTLISVQSFFSSTALRHQGPSISPHRPTHLFLAL